MEEGNREIAAQDTSFVLSVISTSCIVFIARATYAGNAIRDTLSGMRP